MALAEIGIQTGKSDPELLHERAFIANYPLSVADTRRLVYYVCARLLAREREPFPDGIPRELSGESATDLLAMARLVAEHNQVRAIQTEPLPRRVARVLFENRISNAALTLRALESIASRAVDELNDLFLVYDCDSLLSEPSGTSTETYSGSANLGCDVGRKRAALGSGAQHERKLHDCLFSFLAGGLRP